MHHPRISVAITIATSQYGDTPVSVSTTRTVIDAVLAGTGEIAFEGDILGMFSGTDLVERDVMEFSDFVVGNTLRLLARKTLGLYQGIESAWLEGLLTGVEHGKRIGS